MSGKNKSRSTQVEAIKSLRRRVPKAGKVIDTNKKAYRRRQTKADNRRRLAELEG